MQLLTFETSPAGEARSHLYTMHVKDSVKGQPNSTWVVVVSGGIGEVSVTRSVIIHKFSSLGKAAVAHLALERFLAGVRAQMPLKRATSRELR